jgi:hypothetical protein
LEKLLTLTTEEEIQHLKEQIADEFHWITLEKGNCSHIWVCKFNLQKDKVQIEMQIYTSKTLQEFGGVKEYQC